MDELAAKARREEIVGRFDSKTILVIGDLMVDEYLRGTARRISQEGPVMVIEVESDEFKPGGAANAALMLATAGLASAYGAQGVRVNAVNPGATLTERLKEGLAADARLANISTEEALMRVTAKTALGRLAEPEEIANMVLFLASDKSSYVSGTIIAMDGVSSAIVV